MPSFAHTFLDRLVVPAGLVQTIRQIGEHKGRQELYRVQAPEKLENLRQVAMIQSVESSNRIEGVVAAKGRIEALVREQSAPQNRSEGEIAGYRDVLATIHTSAAEIRLSENVVLQLHRDLMKYATGAGGAWKTAANEIEEVRPDGTRRIRFTPTPPHLTPAAMHSLHQAFRDEMKAGRIEPLLLIALYVLDFLCIHPFLDGNGRMARLLTVLLLHQQGYEVGRYISLERLIEQTKESYYDTLHRASQGWHKNKHDPLPWIEYWLGTVLAAYREFESRMGKLATGHGAKTDIVLTAIDRMIGSFSISELQAACPSVSRDWIKIVLDQLKKEGRLKLSGRGRSARWHRAEMAE
ncbi:MAG TPA: Fic family protein [Alphaproteobacteria bacterium]|nr:Fic family protein [Alphaproteobacteria bacterium]